MGSVAQLQQRLDALLAYMQPHWDFVNCHMVNYLTDDHWKRFVPQQLRDEVSNEANVKQCIETQFWPSEQRAKMPEFAAFASFLIAGEQQRLASFSELLTTVEQLDQQLAKDNEGVEQTQLSIKEFMSAKKCHEVELTAALVHRLIEGSVQKNNDSDIYIVDAGDGKGYLSSRLALQYGHRVLGIDANTTNTENALSRNRKLQRAWNGLTERAELQSQGITPKRRGKKPTIKDVTPPTLENYKTASKFITTELNLCDLLADSFDQLPPGATPRICLTGLHTCGNLAATCLQVFDAQPSCQILCNIGCCYHLLKERYSEQEFFGNKSVMDMQTEYGFPLSRYLQDRKVRLGRNARMLAAQSIERTLAAKELPNITLYYRALLELLVCRHAPHLKNELQVGKVRKFENFHEYVQICAKKLDAPRLAALEPVELEALLRDFQLDRHYLELFYLLRMSFAPVLECLILLDRLLYLKELGHDHSYLVSLFDAVISPRHFAIISLKQ